MSREGSLAHSVITGIPLTHRIVNSSWRMLQVVSEMSLSPGIRQLIPGSLRTTWSADRGTADVGRIVASSVCFTDAMVQISNVPQKSDSCCGGSSFGLGGCAGCSDARRSASAMTRGIFLKSSRMTSFRSDLCRPAAG